MYINMMHERLKFLDLCFRLELETKIQEGERRKIDEEARKQAEREKMEERISVAMDAKDSAEKELLVIK